MKLEKTIKTEMKQTVLQGMERVTAKHFEGINDQVAQVKYSCLKRKVES